MEAERGGGSDRLGDTTVSQHRHGKGSPAIKDCHDVATGKIDRSGPERAPPEPIDLDTTPTALRVERQSCERARRRSTAAATVATKTFASIGLGK